ncbi:MAG TPA: HAMP domain-containing sensor histidine kinase [Chthoniobacterales bacterium]
MTAAPEAVKSSAAIFRAKLQAAMMLVVAALTISGLYLAQRKAGADAERNLQRDFQAELTSLHVAEEARSAALAERCRALVEKPRIHAALEDNALDLLYPSAADELRDLMEPEKESEGEEQSHALHARFYRFLNNAGDVLSPPNQNEVGILRPEEESQLALKPLPDKEQTGYLLHEAGAGEERVDEVVAVPINSTETNELIAALVVGFKPVEITEKRAGNEIKSGIWLNGWLHLPALREPAREAIDRELTRILAAPNSAERSYRVQINGAPQLLFYKRLNPASVFPPAYEVCIFPLDKSLALQRRLRWQILGAGVVLLIAGLTASYLISLRLSVPVAKLVVDSEENRAGRKRVEAVLATTNEELKRSARFSADASHQLKTPVTILRAGLEELLGRENFPEEVYDELSSLLHQTYRLTGVIDDLLLLSRMDAGRLQIEFNPVDLTQLIEEWLADLNALPDAAEVEMKAHLPQDLYIAGEKRYISIIVQNLLENARKYNRPGGRVHVTARAERGYVVLTVGNTGRPIPFAMQENIFERFYRGSIGENVPGHGLGLNLARELARLHGGDLHLVCSNEKWTEFEVRFRISEQPEIDPVAAT